MSSTQRRRSRRLKNKKSTNRLAWVKNRNDMELTGETTDEDNDEEMLAILSDLQNNAPNHDDMASHDSDESTDDDDDPPANPVDSNQEIDKAVSGETHAKTSRNPRGAGRPRGSRNRKTTTQNQTEATATDEATAPQTETRWKRGKALPNIFINDIGKHNSYYSKRLNAFRKSFHHQNKLDTIGVLALYNGRNYGINNGIDFLQTTSFNLPINADIWKWIQHNISLAIGQIMLRKCMKLDENMTIGEHMQAIEANQNMDMKQKMIEMNKNMIKTAHKISLKDGHALEYFMAKELGFESRSELYSFLDIHGDINPETDILTLPSFNELREMPRILIETMDEQQEEHEEPRAHPNEEEQYSNEHVSMMEVLD
eukprot:3606_1